MDAIIDIQPSNSIEIPVKSFTSTLERNKFILDSYMKGVKQLDIAKEVGLSEVRIGQIVRENTPLVELNREQEKIRRVHRLKLSESKAPSTIAPKDATELVRVIEAQRKELEGDYQTGNTNNTQINIAINTEGKSQSELWEMARKLLG